MTREELKQELLPHVGPTPETSNRDAFAPILQRWIAANNSLDIAFDVWNEVMVEIVTSMDTKH